MNESKDDKSNPWTTNAPPPALRSQALKSSQAEISPTALIAREAPTATPEEPGVQPAGADASKERTTRASLMNEAELQTLVGAGCSFRGALSFSGHVRIEGEVHGELLGGRVLVIGDGASVTGEISADRVIILGGHVEANISARLGIELYVPAEVSGDLRSPEIFMDRGIRFHGTCDMTETSIE